jgi:uroporphyrinogen decarboxylase
MYSAPQAWDELLGKLVSVNAQYVARQVRAGADVVQVFDSWVGCLTVEDYRSYVLPWTRELVARIRDLGVPVIYFGTNTSSLLAAMKESRAEVIGLDWRIPLDEGWKCLNHRGAVQGNLDPVVLFADFPQVRRRAQEVLDRAASRPGHIFNLGHGILPGTPVENVKALAAYVREQSLKSNSARLA